MPAFDVEGGGKLWMKKFFLIFLVPMSEPPWVACLSDIVGEVEGGGWCMTAFDDGIGTWGGGGTAVRG